MQTFVEGGVLLQSIAAESIFPVAYTRFVALALKGKPHCPELY